MDPLWVIVAIDIREEIKPEFLSCSVMLPVGLFHLQILEEALTDGIVVRVALGARSTGPAGL